WRGYLRGDTRKRLASAACRLTLTPGESIRGTGAEQPVQPAFPLVWRSGACRYLVIAGRCPVRAGQVIVSKSDARIAGWRIGSRITADGLPVLTVSGIYQAPGFGAPYWTLRAPNYFSLEAPPAVNAAPMLDALFTTHATMTHASPGLQGTIVQQDALAI